MQNNPFAVTNPESLNPEDIASLYVNIIDDMSIVTSERHVFIHGIRGTGKSMLLRFLEPEVQIKVKKYSSIQELPFFAIHIPLKNSTFITELRRIGDDIYNYFAEHFLVSLILAKVFDKLASHAPDNKQAELFYANFLKKRLKLLGYVDKDEKKEMSFEIISQLFEEENINASQYVKRQWISAHTEPYVGALFGYMDLLIPALEECQQFGFMPKSPFFLMLDDADNTPIEMQRLLNTWVSCRTSKVVNLKISTQLNYKTYRTTLGNFIEKPHDYGEIDLTTIYSPTTSNFGKRIHDILCRRFEVFKIEGTPESFFPKDLKQENAIKIISERLKAEHSKGKGRGYRPSDDVIRYARAEYMTSLTGTKKASSTYSYSGFESIANLANGVIRWFLEPASQMYNRQKLCDKDEKVTSIPVHIQDEILKKWSEELIQEGHEKLADLKNIFSGDDSACSTTEVVVKLLKLVDALGKIFRKILLSRERSERRVFSFMLSTPADEKLQEVLDLGIKLGFFQRKYIGDKEGLGKKPQYILSRRLAPFYKLDTSGFTGNLSLTSESLHLACIDADKFVQERLSKKSQDPNQYTLPIE